MTEPATPTPDDKDWTWVLRETCPDCGYDAARVSMTDLPDVVGAVVDRFVAQLSERYWEQDPALVSTELRAAAVDVADAFAAVPPDRLDRPGRRSDGASFTVDRLGRYFAHDLVHHEWDVR
jgi:hypothetical protein